MFRLLALFLLISSAALYGADLAGSFSPKSIEFGEINQFATISVDVELKNTSQESLEISRIESSRSEVVPTVSSRNVEPGKSIRLTAKFPTYERVGRVTFHFDIFTGSSNVPDTRIILRGFIDWIVDPVSTKVDMGIVDAEKGSEIRVPIVIRPGEALKILSIEKQGKFFEAEVMNGGASVVFATSKELPWGVLSEKIYALTDNPKQPKIAFSVGADVRGDVVPSVNPIEIGIVEADRGVQQKVRLDGPKGKKLRIGSISVEGEQLEVSVEDCIPAMASCKYLNLHTTALAEKTTSFAGVLKVELPDYDRVLPISFNAMVVKAGTTVRNLNDEIAKSEKEPVSISSVMKSATARPVEMKRPDGSGPLLSWQVANEWGIYGYELYRGMSETGPFARVNDKIVRRISDRDQATGSIYHWRDTMAKVDKTYWYKIQIVYDNGKRQELSTPQKISPKSR